MIFRANDPPRVVAVISSAADLKRAVKIAEPPELFELRLDALAPLIDQVENEIARLPAPLIITARHPVEGGAGSLDSAARRELLARFLPHSTHVDIELRSTRSLATVAEAAAKRGTAVILSFHNFARTPVTSVLLKKAESAASRGADVFKVATGVQTETEMRSLLAFVDRATNIIPIAAMGVGKYGRAARLHLLYRSALSYGYLTAPQAEGQLSVTELMRLSRRRS